MLGYMGIAAAIVLFGGVVYQTLGASDEPNDSSAAVSSDGTRVIEGSVHTVHHTEASLPSSSNPQPDAMPTLVWFSGTWCHFCHAMSPFAHDTADEFSSELAFVEKSVDHDRDAARSYGIRGTPTFVLVDEVGEEIVRFGYQSDAASFREVIAAALEH